MPDVQLDELRQDQDRLHVRVIQPMAGIHLDAGVTREPCGLDQAAEFLLAGGTRGLGIGSGMELDDGGTEGRGGLDLRGLGVDEETDADAGLPHVAEGRLQSSTVGDTVEASLGGDLLAALGNEADIGGKDLQGDGDDLGGVPHLEVELGRDGFLQPEDVVVNNMPPVLTQVGGDPDGSAALGGQRRLDGIGLDVDRLRIPGVAGLPHGGDMVDIDPEDRSHDVSAP